MVPFVTCLADDSCSSSFYIVLGLAGGHMDKILYPLIPLLTKAKGSIPQ